MHEVNPRSKVIFILRNPVDRAYSHYWHLVRTNRAIYTFEEYVQFDPYALLMRGMYQKHIERFLAFFPLRQIYFIVFERFIRDTRTVVDSVCDFLGISKTIDSAALSVRRNRAKAPRFLNAHLFTNYLLQKLGYRTISPNLSRDRGGNDLMVKVILYFQNWNLQDRPYKPMSDRIRSRLQEFYRRENSGLSELTGCDVWRYWCG